MHESQYATYQLENDVGYKVLQFINMMKITKLLGYKTLQCTNTAASWIERRTRAYVSGSQYACEKLLHWGALAMTALKTIFIYVWDCEKRKPKLLLPPLYGSITPYILMLSFYVHQFPMNFFISFSLIHHLPWSSKFVE